ncbi:MAG: SUMF1/EgtB/PvdO family nonheme iron enzyme [Candidatus Eisenbacteria bacterium]
MPGTAVSIRSELAHRLAEARARTDRFFGLIAESALYERAIPERHRLVFYLGHLEAFDWNLVGRQVTGLPSFHPEFDRLFAFGIDPVDGALPSDVPADWPALALVRGYRDEIRARVDDCLAQADPAADDRPYQIAIEHRLMHAETLAYMLPHLPIECFVPAARVRPEQQPGPLEPGYGRTGGPGAVRRIGIPAGRATLGMPREGAGFGWDNELGEHVVNVPAFRMDARNVTNREFLAFVRAGGYDDPHIWSPEDLAWKNAHGVTHPVMWRKRADGWWQRATFVELPLPLDWPVQVSLAEARAFARWKGRRLPTEAELQRATYGARTGGERRYAWGDAPPEAAQHGNFDFERWDPAPVGGYPEGDSAFGVADLAGNGWEWTTTPFAGLPGFVRDELYPGYSEPFFDGKHYVIHGASAQTDRVFLRRSFRNWFQPHYPYVFAAFRCVDHA